MGLSDATEPTTQAHRGVNEDVLYRKVIWRILPFLMLCNIFNFLDRGNAGFAMLQFVHELKFDEFIFGVGSGLYFIGYMVSEIPSNMMTHRFGAKRSLMRIMVMWGLVAACAAWMQSRNEFYLSRIVLGFAEGGFFPGVLLYFTYWIPASRRAFVTATYLMSMSLSGMIGGPLNGMIMHGLDGVAGWSGWRWLFLVEGVPTVIVGILLFFVLSDGPQHANWLTPEERSVILANLEHDADAATMATQKITSFKAGLINRRVYILMVMGIATYASSTALFVWLPSIIRKSGVADVRDVGMLVGIPFLFATIYQYMISRSSDQRHERKWHMLVSSAMGGIGWLLLASVHAGPTLTVVFAAVTSAGVLGTMVIFYAIPASFLTGAGMASGIALITTVGALATFVSGSLVGWLNDSTGSTAAGLYYYASLMLSATVLLAILLPKSQRKTFGLTQASQQS